ncbi:MAG: phosphonate ABC transporter substrate-binding protein [Pleurocapsa sp.]
MLRRKLLATALVLLPLLGVYGFRASSIAQGNNSELIMGLIPAENNEEMVQKFEPMRVHLENKLGRSVKVFQATDYAGVIEAMKRDRVDIAWFGPLSYVLAEQEASAEAFAVGVTNSGLSTYSSIIVVSGDSSFQSLQDLAEKSVAFVDPASTSGALVPTYMVKKATGKMPEEFFGKFTYAGSHDAALLGVKNKTIDAAASSDISYETMVSKGLITAQSNRILVESEPIPGPPLTYRDNLDEATKTQIKDAILNAHNEIEVTGYGDLLRYEEAKPEDYQIIREMVQELGLRREQMLE